MAEHLYYNIFVFGVGSSFGSRSQPGEMAPPRNDEPLVEVVPLPPGPVSWAAADVGGGGPPAADTLFFQLWR